MSRRLTPSSQSAVYIIGLAPQVGRASEGPMVRRSGELPCPCYAFACLHTRPFRGELALDAVAAFESYGWREAHREVLSTSTISGTSFVSTISRRSPSQTCIGSESTVPPAIKWASNCTTLACHCVENVLEAFPVAIPIRLRVLPCQLA